MGPKRDDEFFWQGVDEGKLLVQCCGECDTLRHPPAPMCARCQSVAWEVRALSGRGRVYSLLLSKHPTNPDHEPRTVILVELEEGLRFVSNIAAGEVVEVGTQVRVVFRDTGEGRLPQFIRENAA